MIIRYVNINDIDKDLLERMYGIASLERRVRASRFVNKSDADRCICADILLKMSTERLLDSGSEPVIKKNGFGKPYLSNQNDFFFNITHSGEWVAIGFGDKEIGIDIEEESPEMESIADYCFTGPELDYVKAAGEACRTAGMTEIWTMKESYLKYIGTGLSIRMNSFSVKGIDAVDKSSKVHIRTWKLSEKSFLSACSETEDMKVERTEPGKIAEYIERKGNRFGRNEKYYFRVSPV